MKKILSKKDTETINQANKEELLAYRRLFFLSIVYRHSNDSDILKTLIKNINIDNEPWIKEIPQDSYIKEFYSLTKERKNLLLSAMTTKCRINFLNQIKKFKENYKTSTTSYDKYIDFHNNAWATEDFKNLLEEDYEEFHNNVIKYAKEDLKKNSFKKTLVEEFKNQKDDYFLLISIAFFSLMIHGIYPNVIINVILLFCVGFSPVPLLRTITNAIRSKKQTKKRLKPFLDEAKYLDYSPEDKNYEG